MKKIFIVGNPKSGTGKYYKYRERLINELQINKIGFEAFETSAVANANHVVAQHFDPTFTDIIVIGGDGTLNEAVNALKTNVPIGIIPSGTGNDYAKCFDLGKSIEEKIQTAIHGNPYFTDVGVCNGRKFLNGVGVGFDGQIVADLIQRKTWLKGVFKYYYHVLSILGTYKTRLFDFNINNHSEKKERLILLCVAKGTTFGGGFKLTPHAKPDNGKLSICTIGDISPLKRFLNIFRLQNGTHHVLKEIDLLEANSISIRENALLEAHIDGEYFGKPPFNFSIDKKAIQVRAKRLL
ncbi:MAG: diacylglycerol kinase family lipid kinase [Cyclobacteriaceae bacterium]